MPVYSIRFLGFWYESGFATLARPLCECAFWSPFVRRTVDSSKSKGPQLTLLASCRPEVALLVWISFLVCRRVPLECWFSMRRVCPVCLIHIWTGLLVMSGLF